MIRDELERKIQPLENYGGTKQGGANERIMTWKGPNATGKTSIGEQWNNDELYVLSNLGKWCAR